MKAKILFLITVTLSIAFASRNEPSSVIVPPKLRKALQSFEPSAGIYLSKMGKYLVASDDTDEDHSPYLFLMDAGGRVEAKPVKIHGVKQLTDVESLSQQGRSIYVLSSQGLNKNGKEEEDRNLFLKTRFHGDELRAEARIELRPLLLRALQKSSEPLLAGMRARFEQELDVESHFVKDGELYIGLKDPQPAPSQGVIVNLGNVDDVLQRKVQARLWKTVSLKTSDGVTNRISDLVWKGNTLWATSTSDSGTGHVWTLGSNPARVLDFEDAHPEGLAFDDKGDAMVLFDQGEDGDGLYFHFK